MGAFRAIYEDWHTGSNALKNIVAMAFGAGFLGYVHPAFAILIVPAAIFCGAMNVRPSESKILAFLVGAIFTFVVFSVMFGIGLGIRMLLGG